jgi:outer membrane lipoprotein-sorting protein
MEISFVSNIRSAKNNISESFEGKLVIKDDRLILSTPDIVSWFNGKTLWTYMSRTQEVNVSNPDGDELQSINPLLILKNYKKDFNVSYIGESTSHNNKLSYDIMLIPPKKDGIDRIELQIEKSTFLPAKIVMLMKNDIRNNVTINKIKSIDIADGEFIFPEKEYPNVEIVDLR